jgi:hypothetical protein
MKEDILKMARLAGAHDNGREVRFVEPEYLERFVVLVADAEAKRMFDEGFVTVGHMRERIEAERDKIANWMKAQGYATGHSDTVKKILTELQWEVRKSERDPIRARGASMKEDIIKMAREAGFNLEHGFLLRVTGTDEDLERFAALVADRCAEIAYEAEPWHSADLIRKAFGVPNET